MDFKAILQKILNEALEGINVAIPRGIQAAGLDPWKDVYSDTIKFGIVSLPIGEATAQVEVSISDLTGLSSLRIKSLTVESVGTGRVASVSLSLKSAFDSDLTAQLSGTVSASIDSFSPSVRLNGTTSISGVTGRGDASGGAKLRLGKPPLCLTEFDVGSVSISYEDIVVKIGHLGELNDILQLVSRAVQKKVGKTITVKVPPAIQTVIHKAIESELPFC